MQGGGASSQDVVLPGSPELPGWFSVAADSGWYEAIADSVAGTLAPQPAARTAWMAAGEVAMPGGSVPQGGSAPGSA